MLQDKPRWCIDIGKGIGIGKSLICIRVESMTSPIVITSLVWRKAFFPQGLPAY